MPQKGLKAFSFQFWQERKVEDDSNALCMGAMILSWVHPNVLDMVWIHLIV